MIPVLVMSCFKYRSFWRPFFHLYDKYWPDHPKTYLGTDIGNIADVETISVGNDPNWASVCKKVLSAINEPYIMLLLDDYLLNKPVDNDRFVECCKHMKENDVDCLRLFPCPGPGKVLNKDLEIGKINNKADYKLSLQPALWRTECLVSLLNDDESAWQTEVEGTKRANNMPNLNFQSVLRGSHVISYLQGARRGRWTPEAREFWKIESKEK